MPFFQRIAQVANRSTPPATVEDVNLPGKLRSLWSSLTPPAQMELVSTLSSYVFHLCKDSANLSDANALLSCLTGEQSAPLPPGLKKMESSGATQAALRGILHSKFNMWSLQNEQSRDKLEKLLFETLSLYKPPFTQAFKQLFEASETANVLQVPSTALPAHFASHVEGFKLRVLKTISEDQDDGNKSDNMEWDRRNKREVMRNKLMLKVFRKDASGLDTTNLPLLRQALRQALCHPRGDTFFGFDDKYSTRQLPLADFPTMLNFLLGEETVSQSMADELADMLLEKLRYAKRVDFRNRLANPVAQHLFDVVFSRNEGPAGLHAQAAQKLKAAFISGLRNTPATFHPSCKNIALPFKVENTTRAPKESTALQRAVMRWLRQHRLDDNELQELCKYFFFDPKQNLDAQKGDQVYTTHLDEIRSLLLPQLKNAILKNGSVNVHTVRRTPLLDPNALWRNIATTSIGVERPLTVQTGLHAIVLDAMGKGFITDPEELSAITAAICTMLLPLAPHQALIQKYGMGFIVDAINAQGLGMNALLLANLNWLDQSTVLNVIRTNPLIVPASKSVLVEQLASRFDNELLDAITPGMVAYFNKLDFDQLAKLSISLICKKHFGQHAVTDLLVTALLKQLKNSIDKRNEVIEAKERYDNTRTEIIQITSTSDQDGGSESNKDSLDSGPMVEEMSVKPAKELTEFEGWNALLAPLKSIIKRHYVGLDASSMLALTEELQLAKIESTPAQCLITFHPFLRGNEQATQLADSIFEQTAAPGPDTLAAREAVLKPAIKVALSRSSESAFALVSEQGFRKHLKLTVGNTILKAMALRMDNHVRFDNDRVSDGAKSAIADILLSATLTASDARKSNALKEALATHEPALTQDRLENAITALMDIDPAELKKANIMHVCRMSESEWPSVSVAVEAHFQRWSRFQEVFDDLATSSHQERTQEVLSTMKVLRNKPFFEAYVEAVFPFVTIGEVSNLLKSVKQKESKAFSPAFSIQLKNTVDYHRWMAQRYMVDEDEQNEPLKLYPSSVEAGKATFVQVADLLVLNVQNDDKKTFLKQFQIVDFSGDKAVSDEITLPLLRKTAMPTHIKQVLMAHFTIGPVIAEALLHLCKQIFTARALVMPGSDMELLEQVLHQAVGQPSARMQIELRIKKRLVNNLNDGDYAILATELFKKFENAAALPQVTSASNLRNTAAVTAQQRQDNLVEVILNSEEFRLGIKKHVLDKLSEAVNAIREEFLNLRQNKAPELYELHYMLALLFAKISSIDGLGYHEPGGGGNANTSVAMFRLLSGYCLAMSLRLGRDRFTQNNLKVALNSLQTLMTTDGCSGVVSNSLMHGYSERDIGVRVLGLLSQGA